MAQQIFGILLADHQTPVNPEADTGNVAEWLDMNVTGAGLQRRVKDVVAEFGNKLVIIKSEARAFRLAAGMCLLLALLLGGIEH